MQLIANETHESLAKKFAWLLRSDVQAAYPSTDHAGFEDWWLLKGRQEFPAWAKDLDQNQIEHLFSHTSTNLALAGLEVRIPQFTSMLIGFRPDAVKEFSKRGSLDMETFLAWSVVKGLSEHRLLDHTPNTFLAMLDRPLPATLANANPEAPAATLLMYLVWSLMDKKTQTTYQLFEPKGRQAFLQWFFPVVKAIGITKLVAGRWRAWLLSQPSQNSEEVWPWPQKSSMVSIESKNLQAAAYASHDKPIGLNLYGFAFGELGIGEDIRMAVACCQAANIPFHVVNVKAGADLRQADKLLEGHASDLWSEQIPPYAINVFCLPAFDMVSRIYMQKGPSVFEGYYNIGWWPWEMAVFPKAWAPLAFQLVHEVWASSEFLLGMYKAATTKPVNLMPLAVSVDRAQVYSRAHFGLPEHQFLFLFVFDFNSSTARKNPQAVIEAFQMAFAAQDISVGLVLKVMNVKDTSSDWREFLNQCKADERVCLLTQTLDRPEALGLIKACDAYVSLHRAEGFGRTLAEAMLFGKPVVATDYSGNTDFMPAHLAFPVKYKLVPVPKGAYQWVAPEDGATWAEVDVKDAASQMAKAKKSAANNVAQKIQEFALQQFNPTLLGARIKTKIDSINIKSIFTIN